MRSIIFVCLLFAIGAFGASSALRKQNRILTEALHELQSLEVKLGDIPKDEANDYWCWSSKDCSLGNVCKENTCVVAGKRGGPEDLTGCVAIEIRGVTTSYATWINGIYWPYGVTVDDQDMWINHGDSYIDHTGFAIINEKDRFLYWSEEEQMWIFDSNNARESYILGYASAQDENTAPTEMTLWDTQELHWTPKPLPISMTCHTRGELNCQAGVTEIGRCGPTQGYHLCPAETPFCNESNGYCGAGTSHRDAQSSDTYDYKEACDNRGSWHTIRTLPDFKRCDIDRNTVLFGEWAGGNRDTATEELCKKSCLKTSGCKFIEYYSSGWCNGFPAGSVCLDGDVTGSLLTVKWIQFEDPGCTWGEALHKMELDATTIRFSEDQAYYADMTSLEMCQEECDKLDRMDFQLGDASGCMEEYSTILDEDECISALNSLAIPIEDVEGNGSPCYKTANGYGFNDGNHDDSDSYICKKRIHCMGVTLNTKSNRCWLKSEVKDHKAPNKKDRVSSIKTCESGMINDYSMTCGDFMEHHGCSNSESNSAWTFHRAIPTSADYVEKGWQEDIMAGCKSWCAIQPRNGCCYFSTVAGCGFRAGSSAAALSDPDGEGWSLSCSF